MSIPDELSDLLWIRTANDDKYISADDFMSFNVSDSVVVYVGYDQTIPRIPNWLSLWTPLNKSIETSDTILRTYYKSFAGGTITLGGNEGETSSSMYVVLIDPTGRDILPPAPPTGLSVKD